MVCTAKFIKYKMDPKASFWRLPKVQNFAVHTILQTHSLNLGIADSNFSLIFIKHTTVPRE